MKKNGVQQIFITRLLVTCRHLVCEINTMYNIAVGWRSCTIQTVVVSVILHTITEADLSAALNWEGLTKST